MKNSAITKWIVPIVVAVICAAIIPLLQTHETITRRVIYIKGAPPVLADSVTDSEQFVYYVADGKNGMFLKDDVKSVGTVQVERNITLKQTIDTFISRLAGNMGRAGELLRRTDSRLLIFLMVLPIAFALVWLARIIFSQARKSESPPSHTAETANNGERQRDTIVSESVKSSEIRDIVMFFTDLYRLQNGLPENTPSRFSMTPESAGRKMKVFDLGVKGNSDWLSRRMSIGPLGEDTGSKSKCYYVIYDTHMVVKIPPVPVTDIEKYTTDIRREVKIAVQLAPVACIVPKVSVVLKKFKKLPYGDSLTPEQLEKQYIRLVEDRPEYQEHLTIGGRFAFFMELSNSFFLGRVIDELHESKSNIADELNEAPDMAWDQQIFTTRYGLESLPVFEGLQHLFRLCEDKARHLIREAGQESAIHAYQIKLWFLAAMAGNARWESKGLDGALIERIKAAFSGIFNANPEAVDSVVRLLKRQLAAKTFTKSKYQIENIAANMLQLLCRLQKKRIALRDLKPDNLFLDANPDDYPVFLNDRNAFSIGVIDVETAISLDPAKDGSVAQPLLGGTPLYATPTHVLKNETIAANFGNPAELLHLQDWYATIAIIFKAVTGTPLFPRAARSFPDILKILKSGRSKADPDEATVKAMSYRFWSAAATDMKTRLSTAANILSQLSLRVPEDMAATIADELEREAQSLGQAFERRVTGSALLRRESNRAFLLQAGSEDLLRQQARWQKASELPASHRKVAPQMVAFLKKLHRLRQAAAEKRGAIADLAGSDRKVAANVLLEAMFQIVFRRMYKPDWDAIGKAQPPSSPPPSASATPRRQNDSRDKVTVILNDGSD